MGREKKSIAFSTRFTEKMDDALIEISELKMLSKHDIVRMAISEYLVNHKELINSSIKYKQNIKLKKYDTYGRSISNEKAGNEAWILGAFHDEQGEIDEVSNLVKVTVRVPVLDEMNKIEQLKNELQDVSESIQKKLEKKIWDVINDKIMEQHKVEYTDAGLKVKEDPRLQECIKNTIDYILRKYNQE